jgi:pyruvate formate lyase activating enzyme
VDFEFRTTVVRQLHTEDNIRAIGEWLKGDEKFYLQTFKDSGDLIGEGLSAYSDEEMKALCEVLREFVPKAVLR